MRRSDATMHRSLWWAGNGALFLFASTAPWMWLLGDGGIFEPQPFATLSLLHFLGADAAFAFAAAVFLLSCAFVAPSRPPRYLGPWMVVDPSAAGGLVRRAPRGFNIYLAVAFVISVVLPLGVLFLSDDDALARKALIPYVAVFAVQARP